MSLKAELEKWVKGLESFDAQDYAQALVHFEAIADSSKILFNMGLIHATMGNHKTAIAYYDQAHSLDQYLAVSFFQCGVSHFLMGQFEFAAEHFQNAYFHMRENQIIDYEQIGLKFRLYSAEILFNQGLAYINLNQQNQGMQLLDQARKEKQTNEHAVIDEAFGNYGQNYTVFSIPIGVLFRPSELKVKNMKAKNYLGTAKLVAATEAVDAFIGFSGIGGRKAGMLDETKDPPILPRSKTRSPSSASVPLPALPKASTSSPVEAPVAPLRLSGRKSSVDLRGNVGGNSPFAGAPALPPINTNVPRPSLDQRVQTQAPYPSQGGLAGAVPPTPPDSDPGRQNNGMRLDRDRDSSGTALGYLGGGGGGNKRDTDFMEELVGGYSASELPPLPRSGLPPIPQGQSVDRVADWANKQSFGPQQPGRYYDPSGPLLGRSGTLNRYPTTRSMGSNTRPGMRKRSATQDEYRGAASTGSRDMEDLMSMRTTEMISFRLKLHFEEEIRGMSLDTDTPWSVFYARLQTKFGVADMSLKYKDEDGAFITIADEDDWDSAVDAAREHCPAGRQDGKLEVWVNEGLDR